MEKKSFHRKTLRLYAPPMVIIGATLILLIVVVVLAASNLNREKGYMSQILLEKGAVLIKSFEAGMRTGMMSMRWGDTQVQQLIEEVARQPDVLYLVVTDENGSILADSDRSLIGGRYLERGELASLHPSIDEKWRITQTAGVRSFEVYRYFRPYSNSMRRPANMGCGGTWCSPGNYVRKNQLIFVGFDVAPFEEARNEDVRNTVIVSSVLLILGFTGLLTLFLTQGYRSARRRLIDTSAISDEVVANMPVGLIVTGRDGRITLMNPSAEFMLGVSFKEVRGKFFEQTLLSDLRQVLVLLEKVERILDKEMDCVSAAGDTVSLSVTAARIVNKEGEFIGNVLMLYDLAEIKQLQEAVRRKEKLAAIGGLAAGIAHEIRNPLSSIKGMAAYFRNKFPADSDDNEAAGVMVREADRLNRVVSELLEFARTPEMNFKPVDINSVLDHSVRLIRQEADSKGINLEILKSDDLPQASLDPDRFTQCLLNLYLNSIDAMDSGGELIVRSFREDDKTVAIEIKDTGPGIAPEHIDKIFDPYFTTKATGTGLGLAIVNKIIEAHNGKITVYSKGNTGTVFLIHVPAESPGRG